MTRDLLWVVNSPSFVTGANVAPAATLTMENIDHERLQDAISPTEFRRVGRYFEALLHYWLADIRGVEILAAGHQVKDGKRTVGELDFVYQDETGAIVHCEASVKFFLHHPRANTSHYPGPNATDNFEKKINKLFDRQLMLSKQHWPTVELRHAFVKGMVFWNPQSELPALMPERMPSKPAAGSWYRASDVRSRLNDRDAHGAIASKPHWLGQCLTVDLVPMDSLCAQLDAHFAGVGHPVMVSLCDPRTAIERERAFVVPDHWPDSR